MSIPISQFITPPPPHLPSLFFLIKNHSLMALWILSTLLGVKVVENKPLGSVLVFHAVHMKSRHSGYSTAVVSTGQVGRMR